MVNWILDLLFSPAGYMAMGAATGWLGRVIVVHVLSRVGNEFLRALLGRAWEESRLVLDDVYKTYTLEMSRAKADGTVTEDECAEAKQRAIAAAKAHLGWRMLVGHLVKILTGASASAWLEKKAEEQIAEAEAAGKEAVEAAPPAGAAGVTGAPIEVE